MKTVNIDGSTGEGGGQILRTSLALACVTGKRLHIENIRASRPKPGLAKQHLSSVRAACSICDGKSSGAEQASQVLDFQPGKIKSGDFNLDIGSAGSCTLVLQTVLPALFLADKSSTVTVTGGTHNPLAPPFDFFHETFLPAIAAADFYGTCKLIKHGFFPAGGGKIKVAIEPWQKKTQRLINICEANSQSHIYARIYTAKLPPNIAQRQHKLLLKTGLNIEDVEHIEVKDSNGPGNCVMLRICNGRTTVFTAFGQRGKPSEKVIEEVVKLSKDYIAAGSSVDRFLADQLLIYMAIMCHYAETDKGQPAVHCFITNEMSSHLVTNMEIIKNFLPVDFAIEQNMKPYKISCQTAY